MCLVEVMKIRIVILCSIMCLLWCCTMHVQADDVALAEQYAPVLYFTSGETCYPVEITYFLENSQLYTFVDDSGQLVEASPTLDSIGQYTSNGYFLDNQLGSIQDTGIVTDYQNKQSSLGYTVYAHVSQEGGQTILQYWFFYVFNKGDMNVHEGDWEMVQVILSNGQPSQVMVSQHYSGQQASWDQVEQEDNHPKIFVAQGSHANYLRSYAGKLGLASDLVAANGVMLTPDEYELVLLTNQSWLEYAGRWGAYSGVEGEIRGQVGPFGPQYRADSEMWSQPSSWGASLPQLDSNLLVVEWVLYHIVTIYLVVALVVASVLGFSLYRKYKKKTLGPRFLSLLYIDGVNPKSMGNILCIVGLILVILGLMSQWYGVSANIAVPGHETTGFEDIILIDGLHGVQINLLDDSGQLVQMGAFVFPFAFFIGIGLVFFLLGTIGIQMSRKLGRKYAVKGVRFCLIVVILLIGVASLGFLGPILESGGVQGEVPVTQILGSISSSPFGGSLTLDLNVPDATESSAQLTWGVGMGGWLLLIGGIVLCCAGALEYIANTALFSLQHDVVPTEEKPSKEMKNSKKKTRKKKK